MLLCVDCHKEDVCDLVHLNRLSGLCCYNCREIRTVIYCEDYKRKKKQFHKAREVRRKKAHIRKRR